MHRIFGLFLLLILTPEFTAAQPDSGKGKLFIIGGGRRPPELIRDLIEVSGIDRQGYAVVLPMSSAEPDSAFVSVVRSFAAQGLKEDLVHNFPFRRDHMPASWIDSLKNARLIYITGGSQNRFMEVARHTPVQEAIREAFNRGATIAGTSAGAAVMSRLMITGNEKKNPEGDGGFRTIESENIELSEGLGLLDQVIVDQHFIRRMRLNRLIAVILEHPDQMGIGIDESTAIIVEGKKARVTGTGQVILLRYRGEKAKAWNGLLGGRGLKMSVLLPGEGIRMRH